MTSEQIQNGIEQLESIFVKFGHCSSDGKICGFSVGYEESEDSPWLIASLFDFKSFETLEEALAVAVQWCESIESGIE